MKFRGLYQMISSWLLMYATGADANHYAEAATKVVNAILQGSGNMQRVLLPPLKEEEYAELLKLAACDAEMQGGGGNRYLLIDWRCHSEDLSNQNDRSTLMMFDKTGRIVGFAINRSLESLVPTETALARSDLPSKREILRAFGEAVVSGGDATLGGLIELTSFDQVRLARYADGHFRVWRSRNGGQLRISLHEGKGRSSPSASAVLQFDEDGRPSGLIFAPSYLANVRSSADYDRSFTQGMGNRQHATQPGWLGIAC